MQKEQRRAARNAGPESSLLSIRTDIAAENAVILNGDGGEAEFFFPLAR